MAHHTFRVRTAATPEVAFALWTDLDRMKDWVGGVTAVVDVTGPVDQVGTRYTTMFGKLPSPTEVVAVERPRLFRTKFGNGVLRGESQAIFEPEASGTLITQEFWTKGIIPAVMGWIFAFGSWKGSFQGELNAFARLASAEATEEARAQVDTAS